MATRYKSDVWAPGIFDGKVVLCTGGAGTICSIQVGALVELGANACIIGRRAEVTAAKAAELAALRPGAKVIGLSADVRDYESMEKVVAETIAQLGRIDFVICGAAGNFLATVENLSANAFKSVIDIDVLGSYNTVKACLPELKKNQGRILFVSAALHYTGTPFQAHVSAAKAAVDALSQVLAVELGPYGVTSNVIAPGPIEGTEGMARLSKKDQLGLLKKSTPLQRLGKPYEIADGTVFLFSPAGNYITGDIMVVDGGTWHRAGLGIGNPYPEAVMAPGPVTGVKGMKKSKL